MNLYRHFTANEEQLNQMPFRRELAMQAYIIENPEVLGLDDNVFKSSDLRVIEEEVSIVGGRKSKETDGRIDILAMYSGEYIGVIELKNDELNEEHLFQLEDYLKQKNQILEKHCMELLGDSHREAPKFIGVLVGESIGVELAEKLRNGYVTDNDVPIAALAIKRFSSSLGGVYVTTDIFFKERKMSRNYDKYSFRGKTLTKNRLVLEVVRSYVEENPTIMFSELRDIFPDKLQGSCVFTTEEKARGIVAVSKNGINRHFIKPDDLINLSDAIVAVSNQWGDGQNPNFPEFLAVAKKLYPNEISKDG